MLYGLPADPRDDVLPDLPTACYANSTLMLAEMGDMFPYAIVPVKPRTMY